MKKTTEITTMTINWTAKKQDLEAERERVVLEMANLRTVRGELAGPALIHHDATAKARLSDITHRAGELQSHLETIDAAVAHCNERLAEEEQQRVDAAATQRATLARDLAKNAISMAARVDDAMKGLAAALQDYETAIGGLRRAIPAHRVPDRLTTFGSIVRAFKFNGCREWIETPPVGPARGFKEMALASLGAWLNAGAIYADDRVVELSSADNTKAAA